MLEFIIFLIVSIVFFSLTLNNISLRFKNIKLNEDLIKSFVNYNIVLEKKVSLESDKIENSDGFLKFISDSREYAFKYIESTQEKVNSFINDVGPIIDYLERYASPILVEKQRLSIIEGYKIIKTILPDDYGRIDT